MTSSTAQFDDLAEAISSRDFSTACSAIEVVPVPEVQPEDTVHVATPLMTVPEPVVQQADEAQRNPITDELTEGKFVTVLCEDDFYIGEVTGLGQMERQNLQVVNVSFMACLKRSGNDKNRYWVFPSQNDQHDVMVSSVLDIFPQIDFNHQMSTRRLVVMELLNSSIIENFAQ